MNEEFRLDPDLAHLNHAAVAPWPVRTAEAVRRFAEENAELGAWHYRRWGEREQSLRERLQRLINAPSPDDIALLKNTSEGLSVVAHGLPWHPGDNVVAIRQDFPSNRIVWQSLDEYGVETRLVDLSEAPDDPEGALLAHVDRRTRLLAVSSVQYTNGLRLQPERLGRYCRAHGILFCVDAIQQLGALPFDVQACEADFVVADGHKWMLGPEGIALFYCRPELRPELRLRQYGWHMVEHPHDFQALDWRPADSARRFECGSPNMLGIHGLEASLSLLEEVGIDAVAGAVAQRVQQLRTGLEARGAELLSPESAPRRSGILTFRFPHYSSESLFQGLRASGVLCALRGEGIRFSPHFYTPDASIEKALTAVDACLEA